MVVHLNDTMRVKHYCGEVHMPKDTPLVWISLYSAYVDIIVSPKEYGIPLFFFCKGIMWIYTQTE